MNKKRRVTLIPFKSKTVVKVGGTRESEEFHPQLPPEGFDANKWNLRPETIRIESREE
jgi:hypothetical protein